MTRTLLLLSALLLGACSSKTQWTEEVLLGSGETIVVERKARILRVLLAEGSGSVQEQWFHYPSLAVTWHTENLLELPLSFDIVDGTPYLVSSLGNLCTQANGQVHGVRIVAWRANARIEVPIEQAPLTRLTYNLHRDFQGVNSSDDTHTHQTLEAKRLGWRGAGRFGADPDQGKPLLQWAVLLKRPLRPC